MQWSIFVPTTLSVAEKFYLTTYWRKSLTFDIYFHLYIWYNKLDDGLKEV
jgi:hypothetical protein